MLNGRGPKRLTPILNGCDVDFVIVIVGIQGNLIKQRSQNIWSCLRRADLPPFARADALLFGHHDETSSSVVREIVVEGMVRNLGSFRVFGGRAFHYN